MNVRRAGRLALVFTIGLLAAGCLVENEYSIVDKPEPAPAALAGVWALEADGYAQVLLLRPDDNPERMRASFVLMEEDGTARTSRAAIRFTTIGGRAYFEADWNIGEWLPLDPPVRRSFGSYEIKGSGTGATLTLCFADTAFFEPAVTGGKLDGYVGKISVNRGSDDRMIVSSETAKLRAYLEQNHVRCAIGRAMRRLEGPPQPK